jgi:hypothetical protein
MGQLISKSGVLVGSNFTIDGPYSNDNPVSVAYDGSKYLVAYGDHTTINGPLNIFARFVTTSGSVAIDRINISTKTSVFPTIIFDGTNYFISWTDNVFTSASLVMGRFINTSGVPIDTGFTIFGSLGDKIAAYGISKIGNNKILVVATRVDTPSFSNGDVYGRFINSSSTGVNDNGKNAVPGKYSLGQNYPNPFNPNTTIKYSLPKTGNVNVTVYNALGSKIATIVNEYKSAGNYSVQFNGSNIASGIYLYRLESGNFSATKKFILLK